MSQIKVLGTGCANCKTTLKLMRLLLQLPTATAAAAAIAPDARWHTHNISRTDNPYERTR